MGIVTEPYLPQYRDAELVLESRLHLAGYGVIAGVSLLAHSWAAVLLWVAPMCAMKFTQQLHNSIEHLGLPHDDDIFRNTRSTRTNALMRWLCWLCWLCWQMQYHTAHHAFPRTPQDHIHRLRNCSSGHDVLGIPARRTACLRGR